MKITEQEKRWILEDKYNVKKESELKGGKISDFSTDLKRLSSGEPLAYIIDNIPFLNCKIDLKYRPLIPRTETEFWVNNFLENDVKNQKEKIEILDIFSGSGCIGISILKNSKNKNIFLDFSEINETFIKQIKKNISLNLENNTNYNIFKSDIFKNIPKDKKYNYILANPPYIPKSKKVDSSVIDFEDYNSLFAEDNGLYFVKILILEGLEKLKKNGKMIIEFDETSKDEIEVFLKKEKIEKYIFKKDQFDNWRTLEILK